MQVKELEEHDQEYWEEQRQHKVTCQQASLMKKHLVELNAFTKKMQSLSLIHI